jgi:succinoglycan biosynthesis protein ExoM
MGSDLGYAIRAVLSEHATKGDPRATAILKLLAGEGVEAVAGAQHGPCRVAIGICTAKRPRMLRNCLESIAAQVVPVEVEVEVVVVDNEGERNNQSLVQDTSINCRFPIHYVHAPRRGIPQARNAALEKCREIGADWIAFTDDDCWASPTWVASLLAAAARYRADVVQGRREFVFPTPLPFWAMRAEQGTYGEGEQLPYAATHNVLFSARLIDRAALSLRFDERLAHGEDTDFFFRAAVKGARIVYSAEPMVLEAVTADRATLHYQTRRAYHYAASRSYFHRRYNGVSNACMKLAARCLLQAPVAMGRLLVAPLAWPFDKDLYRALVSKGTARLAGAAGATAGLFGYDGNPYRTIDGY